MTVSASALPAVPAPGEAPDWEALLALPEIAALDQVPQDPLWHAEGDALVHTRMVVAEMLADPSWRALEPGGRLELFWAAVLHDIGKAKTTRLEDGRWTAPNHARVGAQLARRLLWHAGTDRDLRERVCALVAQHMVPPRILDRDVIEQRRRVLEIALECGCETLRKLSRADVQGRLADDVTDGLELVELYGALCDELGVLDGPVPFASDHARVTFFRDPERHPALDVFDDTRSRVWVMSGLPGAGKDHWIAEHLDGVEMISLDALRRQMKVRRGDARGEGQVRQAARARARELLAAGAPLVWNATNLSRQMRGPLLSLLADYRAHITIVSVEPDPKTLYAQNRDRAHPVPAKAIGELVERWEPPTLAECHRLIVA